MKLKIFTAPDEYQQYLAWRDAHQRYAICVMLAAVIWAFVG